MLTDTTHLLWIELILPSIWQNPYQASCQPVRWQPQLHDWIHFWISSKVQQRREDDTNLRERKEPPTELTMKANNLQNRYSRQFCTCTYSNISATNCCPKNPSTHTHSSFAFKEQVSGSELLNKCIYQWCDWHSSCVLENIPNKWLTPESRYSTKTWKILNMEFAHTTLYLRAKVSHTSGGLHVDSRQHLRISLNYGWLKVAFEMETIFFWELSEDLSEEKKNH